jgi:Domain of Unknown Function with PDB structure (DUF3862)
MFCHQKDDRLSAQRDYMNNKLVKIFCLFFFVLLSVSCMSRINKTNYDQIQAGMSYQTVVDILGSPTSTATLSFGDTTGISANWENRNGAIKILFFNGIVKVKQYIQGVTTPRES